MGGEGTRGGDECGRGRGRGEAGEESTAHLVRRCGLKVVTVEAWHKDLAEEEPWSEDQDEANGNAADGAAREVADRLAGAALAGWQLLEVDARRDDIAAKLDDCAKRGRQRDDDCDGEPPCPHSVRRGHLLEGVEVCAKRAVEVPTHCSSVGADSRKVDDSTHGLDHSLCGTRTTVSGQSAHHSQCEHGQAWQQAAGRTQHPEVIERSKPAQRTGHKGPTLPPLSVSAVGVAKCARRVDNGLRRRPRRFVAVLAVCAVGHPDLDELAILGHVAVYAPALLGHIHKGDGAVVGCPRVEGAVHCGLEVIARDKRVKEQILLEERRELGAQCIVPCPRDAAAEATVVAGELRVGPQEAET